MAGDDAMHHCQTHAGSFPLGFRGEEWLKDSRLHVCLYPMSRIAND
jgi:hypothetical protein